MVLGAVMGLRSARGCGDSGSGGGSPPLPVLWDGWRAAAGPGSRVSDIGRSLAIQFLMQNLGAKEHNLKQKEPAGSGSSRAALLWEHSPGRGAGALQTGQNATVTVPSLRQGIPGLLR